MSLLWRHKRKSLFLKLVYLSGIVAVLIVGSNLLKLQSNFINTKVSEDKPSLLSSKNKVKETELTIRDSIFKGVNKDLEPYEISASIANKLSDDQFSLSTIDANYMIGSSNLLINAKAGLLNNLDNWMDLRDDVRILFNNLLLNTKEIHINLITKEASSKAKVEMLYKNSKIEADSFTSENNSDIIKFRGNVQTKIKLKDF